MESALGDFQRLIRCLSGHAVHEPVCQGYAPRPPALEISAERLRLSSAGKGGTEALPDQSVQSGQCVGVILPVEVILPSLGRKNQLHGPESSRSSPLPASRLAMAAANRSALTF